jgi:hypothetical protein
LRDELPLGHGPAPNVHPGRFDAECPRHDRPIARDDRDAALVLHDAGLEHAWYLGFDGAGVRLHQRREAAVGLRRKNLHVAARADHDHVETVPGDERHHFGSRPLTDDDDRREHRHADRKTQHHERGTRSVREQRPGDVTGNPL